MGDAEKRRDYTSLVKGIYVKVKRILLYEADMNKAIYEGVTFAENMLLHTCTR